MWQSFFQQIHQRRLTLNQMNWKKVLCEECIDKLRALIVPNLVDNLQPFAKNLDNRKLQEAIAKSTGVVRT